MTTMLRREGTTISITLKTTQIHQIAERPRPGYDAEIQITNDPQFIGTWDGEAIRVEDRVRIVGRSLNDAFAEAKARVVELADRRGIPIYREDFV